MKIFVQNNSVRIDTDGIYPRGMIFAAIKGDTLTFSATTDNEAKEKLFTSRWQDIENQAGDSFASLEDTIEHLSIVLGADNITLPIGASTEANQGITNTRIGDLTESAPISDVASSGLNGRLQRISQRITTLIGSVLSVKDETIGNLQPAVVTTVSDSSIQIQAANVNRKRLLIQNLGPGSVFIGQSGVSITTGFRLQANESVVLQKPYVATNAIYAIRDGGSDKSVITAETI